MGSSAPTNPKRSFFVWRKKTDASGDIQLKLPAWWATVTRGAQPTRQAAVNADAGCRGVRGAPRLFSCSSWGSFMYAAKPRAPAMDAEPPCELFVAWFCATQGSSSAASVAIAFARAPARRGSFLAVLAHATQGRTRWDA